MRIVAGAARGLSLLVPQKGTVRPTPDRVREALFSILGERVVGARVLDACAGTGALGLEAASRGAAEVLLVERDWRVTQVLRENVKRVGLDVARVVSRDVRPLLRELAVEDERFDIVLLDPPFDLGLAQPLLEALAQDDSIARDGVVVLEHRTSTEAPVVPALRLTDQRRYGTVTLSFYEPDP